jgi:hypothetical protein
MTVDFNQAEIETLIELIEAAWLDGFDHDELTTTFEKLKEAENGMMTDQKTFYVTKYALNRGPFIASGEVAGRYASFKDAGEPYPKSLSSKDFCLNKEDAITDCERRRDEKIESFKKQIAKLENMRFTL